MCIRDSGQIVGGGSTLDSRPAQHTVEPLIGKPKLIGFDCSYSSNASAFPDHATHFEKICEIGVEFDRKINFHGREAVIDETQRLMTGRFPQHFCSCDVQRSSRYH